MTVRNQPAMTIDDISRLTARIGSEFILDNMFVLPTKGGNPAEINTQAGRAAFLRGVAAAVAADHRREGTISNALVERELEREGISLRPEHQALLRDIAASDLVRRVHETADGLHRAPMKAEEHADPGDLELRRAINLLRKARVGEFLSDFVDPDIVLGSGNSVASPGPARSPNASYSSESLVAWSPDADPGLKSGLRRSPPMPALQDADRPATTSEANEQTNPTLPLADTAQAGGLPHAFGVLWSQFTRDKATLKEWGQQQQNQAKSTMRVFIEICGDRAPQAYTTADADTLKLTLLSLPAKYAHDKRWCDIRKTEGLKRVAEIATAENEAIAVAHRKGDRSREKHKTLDEGTYNRHHSNLAEFWRWAERKGLLKFGHGQIFDGLFIDEQKVSGRSAKAKARRDEWLDPALGKLFSAAVLTGLRSRHWWKQSGELVLRDDRYWGCILGPHHGMRREEIFQLKVGHVLKDVETGIWHFDLMADDLRLKDTGSARRVPLHDNVIELGFVEERVVGRLASDMLFPEAIRQDAAGYHGAYFGDWFGRFCDWLEVPTNNDFHAFRTTFINRLRRAGVAPHLVDELAGHESHQRRSAQEEYDRGLPLADLKQLIDKLVLPIDVAALKAAARRYGRVDFKAYEEG